MAVTNRSLREEKRAERKARRQIGESVGGELSALWRALAPWALLATAIVVAPAAWWLARINDVQVFSAICIALAGAVMLGVSLKLTRRRDLGRWHELFNVSAPVGVIAWTIAFGPDRYVLVGGAIFGITSAIIWNRRHTSSAMRELELAAGGYAGVQGNVPQRWQAFATEHMPQVAASKMTVFTNTPEVLHVGIDLGPGEVPDDLTDRTTLQKLTRFGGGILGGTTVAVGDYLDKVGVTILRVDPLKKPFAWNGPTAPGESIIEPIEGLGKYRDGLDLSLLLPHVAAKTEDGEDKAHSHMTVVGMSRSGKGSAGEQIDVCVATRKDSAIVLCDPVKADQQLGAIGQGAAYVLTNPSAIRAFLHRLVNVTIPRRAAYLGSPGHNLLGKVCKEWEPGCGLTWLLVHVYEAAALFNNPHMTQLSERAASVGIQLMYEVQIAKHDKVDTNLRSNAGDLLHFGVKDPDDAALVMPPELLDMGATPWAWGNRRGGMCYAALGHLSLNRQAIPARFGRPARDGSDIEGALAEYMHLVDPLDPITADSWGEPYQKFAAARAARADSAPRMHSFAGRSAPAYAGQAAARPATIAGAVLLDERPAPRVSVPPAAERYSAPVAPPGGDIEGDADPLGDDEPETGFDLDDPHEEDPPRADELQAEREQAAERVVGDLAVLMDSDEELREAADEVFAAMERHGGEESPPDPGMLPGRDMDFPEDPDEQHFRPIVHRDEAFDILLDVLRTKIGEGNTFRWADVYDELEHRARRGESWVRKCRKPLMGWGCIQETETFGVFEVIHTRRGDLDDYAESLDEAV
ncbi:hypothetical protein AB0F17_28585 [Nonomuraea sp. NPDC026600]|uniref:hypothetical protein n=1 Tax=Nonomuraea sp. NPDC026600 TaxID=3155363 RepID=UPI0033CCEBE2